GWGRIDASQRTKDSFMAELLAPLRRTLPPALRRFPLGSNGLDGEVRPGVLGMDEPGSHSGVADQLGDPPESPPSHALRGRLTAQPAGRAPFPGAHTTGENRTLPERPAPSL